MQVSSPLQQLQGSFVELEGVVRESRGAPTQLTSNLTPSKRCTIEGATALREMLTSGLKFLEDPSNPSPDRRQMYAVLKRAGVDAMKRAKDSRDGNSKVLAPGGEFEKRHGHEHNPSQCSKRFLTAAERARGRKQLGGTGAVTQQRSRVGVVPMEVALELGCDGQLDMSSSKLALNEKKLPHSICDRSERIIRGFHKQQSNKVN
jgi:hypothetical protein